MSNIYVSNQVSNGLIVGNDTTGNGTKANPYLTIAKALSVCVSKDQILVNDGIYQETGTLDTNKEFLYLNPINKYKTTIDIQRASTFGFRILGSASYDTAFYVGHFNFTSADGVRELIQYSSTQTTTCKLFSWARWQPSATQAEWHFISSNANNYTADIMDGGICATDGSMLDLGNKILGQFLKPKSNAGSGNVCVLRVHKFLFNVRAFLPSVSGSAPFFLNFTETSNWADWDISVSGIYGKIINTNTITMGNCHVVKIVAGSNFSKIIGNHDLRIENESEVCMMTPFAIHNPFASRPTKRPVIACNTNIQIKANHGITATVGREVTKSYIEDGAIHSNEFFVETFGSEIPTIHGPAHLLTDLGSGYRCYNLIHGAVIGTLTKESNAISFGNEIHAADTVCAYAKGTYAGAKFFDETLFVSNQDIRVEQATSSNTIVCDDAQFWRSSVCCVGDVTLTNTDSISSLLTIGGSGEASTGSSYGMRVSTAITLPPVVARISGVNYADIASWNAAKDSNASVGIKKTTLLISGVTSDKTDVTFNAKSSMGDKIFTLYKSAVKSGGEVVVHLPIASGLEANYTANSGYLAGAVGSSSIVTE